ncbi:5,6-dimethylbenzimidazole synthase [Uliginosibacterium sp. 31-12]|uniref:5,6-dimethylbenzimidazole synthase n=1 Tax=Uliginosibacterium sp. 31-12 TaxID=3062781 RepID=UPI0034C5D9C2
MKIAIGLGCDRGTPQATLERAVDEALEMAGAVASEVVALASITLKADEAGLLALAQARGWPLCFYPPALLAEVAVPNPSETVRHYTGTPSVSEAAALLAAQATDARALRVEKHRVKGADGRNATVSVAAVDAERILFDQQARQSAHALLAARRDMRHFQSGCSIDAATRERLAAALMQAPSVGLMQPWRVLRISDTGLRARLADCVSAECERTAQALGSREEAFRALKVEGVRECAELWVVLLAPDDGTVFGRRTMAQEMAWCSVGAAVQNLWLAARAENLGLGWVSLFEPAELAVLLQLPPGAQALGLLCIGPVASFYPAPMLSITDWRQPRAPAALFGENRWAFSEDSAADACASAGPLKQE